MCVNACAHVYACVCLYVHVRMCVCVCLSLSLSAYMHVCVYGVTRFFFLLCAGFIAHMRILRCKPDIYCDIFAENQIQNKVSNSSRCTKIFNMLVSLTEGIEVVYLCFEQLLLGYILICFSTLLTLEKSIEYVAKFIHGHYRLLQNNNTIIITDTVKKLNAKCDKSNPQNKLKCSTKLCWDTVMGAVALSCSLKMGPWFQTSTCVRSWIKVWTDNRW